MPIFNNNLFLKHSYLNEEPVEKINLIYMSVYCNCWLGNYCKVRNVIFFRLVQTFNVSKYYIRMFYLNNVILPQF